MQSVRLSQLLSLLVSSPQFSAAHQEAISAFEIWIEKDKEPERVEVISVLSQKPSHTTLLKD